MVNMSGYVNELFSKYNVYDAEGNMQWGALESAFDLHVGILNSGQFSVADIEYLLAKEIYPIVRVRVNGIGNYHYVLIVNSEDGQFWCMDPLSDKEELMSLSEYGNRIYAVRWIEDNK